MTRKSQGDDRVVVRQDAFVKAATPKRPPAPPKPPRDPNPNRVHRTRETIGGEGMRMEKGSRIKGNMPCCTLTDEVFDQIIEHVRAGNFRGVSAKAAGVPLKTFFYWLSVGREQIEDFIDGKRDDVPRQGQFVIALEQAEGQCFIEHHAIILGAGAIIDDVIIPADIDDRKLRFAWLTKRFAREWAPPTTGTDDETGAPKQIDVTELLIARLQALKDADG